MIFDKFKFMKKLDKFILYKIYTMEIEEKIVQ